MKREKEKEDSITYNTFWVVGFQKVIMKMIVSRKLTT